MVPRPIRDTCSPLLPTRRRCTSGSLSGDQHRRGCTVRRREDLRPPEPDVLRQRDVLGVSWLEIVVLGLVQGLTEFLPISSSAHLRIVSGVFFGNDPGASFTAVSQLGTEAAVLIYFARDIGHLVATWFRGITNAEVRSEPDYRLSWLVIIGTIPIGLLGFVFKHQIETVARNLWVIATTMLVFGILLGLAEYLGRQKLELRDMSWRDGVVLGLAQAMALIPGVSRSGGTITAGL